MPLTDADNWLHLALGLGMLAAGLTLGRAVPGPPLRELAGKRDEPADRAAATQETVARDLRAASALPFGPRRLRSEDDARHQGKL